MAYMIERMLKMNKICLRDILMLDEYGIEYENIGAEFIIVHYDGVEHWLKFA